MDTKTEVKNKEYQYKDLQNQPTKTLLSIRNILKKELVKAKDEKAIIIDNILSLQGLINIEKGLL